MVEQDGPAEIDRITLRSIVCLHCRQQFATLTEAKTHDMTCPQHPAVQQLAVAKRLVAACVEIAQYSPPWPDDALRECLQSLGIVREIIYDPDEHGEIDEAEEGEAWMIVTEEWREEEVPR